MKNNRLGVLGYYYAGMLDVYSDLTKQSSAFGTQIEIVEMCEVKKYRGTVKQTEVDKKLIEFLTTFEVIDTCEEAELIRSAKHPLL
jgi:L-arabinose isomerase